MATSKNKPEEGSSHTERIPAEVVQRADKVRSILTQLTSTQKIYSTDVWMNDDLYQNYAEFLLFGLEFKDTLLPGFKTELSDKNYYRITWTNDTLKDIT